MEFLDLDFYINLENIPFPEAAPEIRGKMVRSKVLGTM
jgi:hypothetical protein